MSFDDVLDCIKKGAPDASKQDDIVDTLFDVVKYRNPMEFIDGLYSARTAATNLWYNATERAKKISRDMLYDEHYHSWDERATKALRTCAEDIREKSFGIPQGEAIEWLKAFADDCDAIATLISNKEAASIFANMLKTL